MFGFISFMKSDRFAAGLLGLGLKQGDRVGIWGPNSLEWVLTQYATARAGIILVNLNPLYRRNELEYAMSLVQCKAVVCDEQYKDQNYYDILLEVVPELATMKQHSLRSHALPDLRYVIMMGNQERAGTIKFSDVLEAGSEKDRTAIQDLQNKLQFDQPINIQFTSGTTGFPKGATLSHHNIVNNSYFTGRRMGFHERKARICVPVPLYHCFGMVCASLQIPNHGATCVFPSPAFDPATAIKSVSDERCTVLYGVPTMFIDMLNHPSVTEVDLSSLYTGIMGGSPCPAETMKQVIEQMHMSQVTVAYGTTENSPLTFQTNLDDDILRRVSTVGRVHPHIEAKIVNEDDEIQPLGSPGELCTRGYATMLEYWRDQTKTEEVISKDRWYKTGDIAIMHDGGFVEISGRIKDMIIRGGENIYPLEIEQVLYTHTNILDVQVIGVPDKRFGEQVCAMIKLKDGTFSTADDIKQFCKKKMATYKVPKYIQFVTEYPMTVSGKVQKYKLREKAIQDLNLT